MPSPLHHGPGTETRYVTDNSDDRDAGAVEGHSIWLIESYSRSQGPHRGDCMGPVDDLRCEAYGTLMKNGIWKFNYAVHVMCFRYDNCNHWVSSLCGMDAMWAGVVGEAQNELCNGVVMKD